MTTRNDTGTDRRTLTQFISGFGIEYRWLYANERGSPPVDPDTDWAVFTARDSFMAWEMLHCLAPHIAAIRSSVWLNDDGDIIMPLGISEISLASAALRNFWRDFDRRTSDLRMLEHKYAPAGRIARTIYRETIEKFLWHWEGSDAEFREPWRPTQWTHEFPLALGELLKTLDREAAMLAGIAGTSRTSDTDSRKLAELPAPRTLGQARPRTSLDRPPAPLHETAACPGRLHGSPSRPGPRQSGGAGRTGLVRAPAPRGAWHTSWVRPKRYIRRSRPPLTPGHCAHVWPSYWTPSLAMCGAHAQGVRGLRGGASGARRGESTFTGGRCASGFHWRGRCPHAQVSHR